MDLDFSDTFHFKTERETLVFSFYNEILLTTVLKTLYILQFD